MTSYYPPICRILIRSLLERNMPQYTSFASHLFSDLDTAPFDPKSYSRLKFGSDQDARRMGHHLATEFFFAHGEKLLINECVVISSPYNHLPNAATIMTKHFIDRLNELLVFTQGKHVEYTVVHRKVSYTNDYGFLSKEQRRYLIDNDSFYLNRDFIEGKMLIFVDDVMITGTHEDKLKEVLTRDNVINDAMFLYFAKYTGNPQTSEIEGALNFAAVTCMADFVAMAQEPNHHVIIRPIKYMLGRGIEELKATLPKFCDDMIFDMYYGCLAEGYYNISSYQAGFAILTAEKERRSKLDR